MHKTQDPTLPCLQDTHFRIKNTKRLKVNRKVNTMKTGTKRVPVAILVTDKTGTETEEVIRHDRNILKSIRRISPLERHT